MADYLDPTDQPNVGGSVDASKPKVQKLWDAWTSKPENNAALLQFGLAMLQPRAPGQSGVGAAANAVAEAGGASGRVVAQQKADDLAASTEEDRKATTAAKTATAAASTSNAAAYGRSVDNATGGGDKGVGAKASLRIQQDFRKWLAKPDDTSGLSVDPVVGAIQKRFPNVKNKGDLLADPAARAEAFKLFSSQMTTEPSDTGDITTEPTPATTPPIAAPSAPIRRYNAQGKAVEWNGTKWVPIN